MTRKISIHNLYKISKIIVIVISLISLSYAVFVHSRLEEINKTYVREIYRCMDLFAGNNPEKYCDHWHKYLGDANNAVVYGYLLGIGLPVLFFGGRFVIDYIAPKVEDKSSKK